MWQNQAYLSTHRMCLIEDIRNFSRFVFIFIKRCLRRISFDKTIEVTLDSSLIIIEVYFKYIGFIQWLKSISNFHLFKTKMWQIFVNFVPGTQIDFDYKQNGEVLTKVRVFSDLTRKALSVRAPYTKVVIVKYANIFY